MSWYGNSALYKVISKVTTPATSFDLIDMETVKDELGLSINTYDTSINRYIIAVSASIAQYCNRVFALQSYQDTFFPQRDPPPCPVIGGVDPLQLAQSPLVAGSSVVTEGTTALTLGTDYLEDPPLAQLTRLDQRGYPMRWPKKEIVVAYQAGYAANAYPADLQDAALEFVRWRFFARTRDPGVKSQEVPGDIRQEFLWGSGPGGPLDIPATVSGKIDRYRRVPIV